MKRSQASLFALAGLFAATSVLAQQAPGMVNVDLGTVANTIAKNIKVEIEKVPASLKVPVGIAAAACGVPAARLAPAGGDAASCLATSTTAALDDAVLKQMKAPAKQ